MSSWKPSLNRRILPVFSVPLAFLVCALILPGHAVYAADLPGVSQYSMSVRLSPSKGRLEAEAGLTIKNLTSAPLREVPFVLYRLLAVDSAADEAGKPLSFQQQVLSLADEKNLQANAVVVSLREPLPSGGTTRITLKYSGAIFGYTEVMRYVHDQISEDYSLLRPDALAYPILARPSFESLLKTWDGVFTYDVQVSVPAGYVVACGGLPKGVQETSGVTTYRFSSRVPANRMDIAAAKFRVSTNGAGNLVVYSLPADEAGALLLLKEMQRSVEFYSQRFGSLNGSVGYTVIEIPEGWGSQAADSYVLQAAAAFKDPKRVDELYHEIAHSWNAKPSVGVQRTRYFDEAFGSYFAALAVGEFSGPQGLEEHMARSRDHFRQAVKRDAKNASTPIAEYGKYEMGRLSYTKGAWSLYVLHQVVGDEQFNSIIRAFLAEHADKPADFRSFQQVTERVTGREMSRFFNEWIFGAESSGLLMGNASIQEIAQRYGPSGPKN